MTHGRLSTSRLGSGESGFTLLEALIAVALMGVLLAMLATVTRHWMANWRTGFDRVQSADLLGLGLDRIAADLAAAEYVSLAGENAPPLFNGTPSSVTFVRSAIGPNASAGQLEIVRLRETDDARGPVLVRDLVSFEPVTAEALDDGTLEFTKPVKLMRPPFRISFAFVGSDGNWQETWHDVKLPNAVRVMVRNTVTDQILPVSTATLLNVNAPAECVRSGVTTCGGQNNRAAIPNRPGTTQPGPGPPPP